MHGTEYRAQRKAEKAQRLCPYLQAVLTIECHFCGRTEEHEMSLDDSRTGVALVMFDNGWREVTSKYFGVVAPACPECAKAKDKERGSY